MTGISRKDLPRTSIRVGISALPVMLSDLLRGAFEAVSDIEAIGPGNDHPHLVEGSGAVAADIVLFHFAKPDDLSRLVRLIDSALGVSRTTKVITLVNSPSYVEVIALFRAGVRGIVSSLDLRFDLLCKAIRCVYQGEVWASNEQVLHLVSSLSNPLARQVTDSQGKALLTSREQQVLHLLSEGLSNSELAEILKLSEHTIKNHLFRIYNKLGVSTRMEAVLYALAPQNSRPAATIAPSNKTSPVVRNIRTG